MELKIIQKRIREIRDKNVMLDLHLVELHDVKTIILGRKLEGIVKKYDN